MEFNDLNGITSLYNEYKHYITVHKDIQQLKQKVVEIIVAKQFIPMMNDLKWIKLQHAVSSLAFEPPYVLRCIANKDKTCYTCLNEVPNWLGDWSNYYHEGMPPLFMIEWLKVRPQLSQHRGRLIADAIIDETTTFRAILERLRIPYDEEDNIFTIYGYKQAKHTTLENTCHPAC